MGINMGYANYESVGVEDDAFTYGAQVGFVVEVTEDIDVDLGYRYTLSSGDKYDHTGSIVLGANYFFK